jgi:hypothetical protein
VTDGGGPDLSLIDTADLVAELRRRHDGILVVLERDADATKTGTLTEWWGGLSRCIGLAERAKARMLQSLAEDGEPPEEE